MNTHTPKQVCECPHSLLNLPLFCFQRAPRHTAHKPGVHAEPSQAMGHRTNRHHLPRPNSQDALESGDRLYDLQHTLSTQGRNPTPPKHSPARTDHSTHRLSERQLRSREVPSRAVSQEQATLIGRQPSREAGRPASSSRRRRESNPGTGLCRPLPQPLGHAARPATP